MQLAKLLVVRQLGIQSYETVWQQMQADRTNLR